MHSSTGTMIAVVAAFASFSCSNGLATLHHEQVVLDLASLNRSQMQEASSSMESLLSSSQNETNESSVQLAAAWGIPNHPIRRAMVCHAVFGAGHRFLRRACWLSGFVQTSAGMNNSNASLDISELDEVDKSLGYSVSNASNASDDELTSQWGIPHHPIARAMVCHAVFGPNHRFLRRACWWSGR